MLPHNASVIHGPPGCGKTTRVLELARETIAKHGPGSVLVASLTRSAAREVAGRAAMALGDDAHTQGDARAGALAGTLHGFAYRALGLGPGRVARVEASPFAGDRRLGECQRLRGACVPAGEWPGEVRELAARWDAWKRRRGLLDFEDILERAAAQVEVAPGEPRVLLVDEAQDLSALELRLAARWGAQAESLVLVGDPDQAIYSFRGAAPGVFEGVPAGRRCVLEQSHRLPRAVHALATDWIAQVPGRHAVQFRPREAEGRVRRIDGRRARPAQVARAVRRDLAFGRSVMVLAACGYHLEGLRGALGAELGRPGAWRRVGRWLRVGWEWVTGREAEAPEARGVAAPRLWLGTIHAAKGGEADVVYVLPDLSPRQRARWGLGDEARAELVRMFYVAFTRAREEVGLVGWGELPARFLWPVGPREGDGELCHRIEAVVVLDEEGHQVVDDHEGHGGCSRARHRGWHPSRSLLC